VGDLDRPAPVLVLVAGGAGATAAWQWCRVLHGAGEGFDFLRGECVQPVPQHLQGHVEMFGGAAHVVFAELVGEGVQVRQ
jgi:hypothetical protein